MHKNHNARLKISVRNRKIRDRHKKYAKLVSTKLEMFMADYNKDVLEIAYLAGVSYQTIMDIYWENPVDFTLLAHVSSCIDAIRHNRYYDRDTWRLIPKPMYTGGTTYPNCDLEYFIYDKDWRL